MIALRLQLSDRDQKGGRDLGAFGRFGPGVDKAGAVAEVGQGLLGAFGGRDGDLLISFRIAYRIGGGAIIELIDQLFATVEKGQVQGPSVLGAEGLDADGANAGGRIIADGQETLEGLVESFFALAFPRARIAGERISAFTAKDGAQVELLVELMQAVARSQVFVDRKGVVDPGREARNMQRHADA
ncbi:hypothetical protein D3C80_1207650 [compost metagenome]